MLSAPSRCAAISGTTPSPQTFALPQTYKQKEQKKKIKKSGIEKNKVRQ
jgi:hypothetical protein